MSYKQKYLKHYGYGEQDFVPCMVCGRKAVDVHHIKFRSRGGTDDIENLIALCRECHNEAHDGYLTEGDLKLSKWYFNDKIKRNGK